MGSTVLRRRQYLTVEILAFIAIIAVTLFFRVWRLAELPPGLHYDEAIDLQQGLRILSGDFFLYAPAGWGREGLNYYIIGGLLSLVPDNVLALRLATVISSLGLAVVSYLLARRIAGRLVAWFAVAWLAVTFWPVFVSRFGVRGMSLSFVFGLTSLIFWWAWATTNEQRRRKLLRYALAGFLLGLAVYTYQPSRFLPLIFILFAIYLRLFHKQNFIENRFGLALMAIIALVTALPLMLVLISDSTLEASRTWTIAPLTELFAGRPGYVWRNVVATMGMFSFEGDRLIADNVPGRPVFRPSWTSILFFAGLVLAAWRWRKPSNAFVLTWLAVALAPTIVTIGAPNFHRTVAALFPVAFLSAAPIGQLHSTLSSSSSRLPAYLATALGLIALLMTASATWQDYFGAWPRTRPEDIAVQFHTDVREMGSVLAETEASGAILINSRNLEDAHPLILESIMDRDDIAIRWVDTGQSIAWPSGYDDSQLFLPYDKWIDGDLSSLLDLPVEPLAEYETFAVYDVSYSNWSFGSESVPVLGSKKEDGSAAYAGGQLNLPVLFGEHLALHGVQARIPQDDSSASLTLLTSWHILKDGEPAPLAFFAHLVDGEGHLIAQHDGLGYPPHTWKAGDRLIHMHRIGIPAVTAAGDYMVRLGVYNRDDGHRWPVSADGVAVGDHTNIGPIRIDHAPTKD
ncbi:MAG: glucosyltransferase domain-containing protein [Chloroflexota bacterium]|nr:MAG: glucosyltransferase domain-containing protein [Chloroflexota bacterium]